MNSQISIGQSAQALYENIKEKARQGYTVDSGCAVSINSGTLGQTDTLSVASGTVYFGGSSVSVSSQNVGIDAADPDNPRKDVVYLDGTGTATVAKSTPAEPPQTQKDLGAQRVEFYQPRPAALDATDAVVLAEVWVPAGASSLSSGDVADRRVSATVVPTFETSVDAKGNDITNVGALSTGELTNTLFFTSTRDESTLAGRMEGAVTDASNAGGVAVWDESGTISRKTAPSESGIRLIITADLTLASGTDNDMIEFADSSDILIRFAGGSLDGNGSNQSTGARTVLNIQRTDNFAIYNPVLRNSFERGIQMQSAARGAIYNPDIRHVSLGAASDGISFHDSEDIDVYGGYIEDCVGQNAVGYATPDPASHNCNIHGLTAVDCQLSGVFIESADNCYVEMTVRTGDGTNANKHVADLYQPATHDNTVIVHGVGTSTSPFSEEFCRIRSGAHHNDVTIFAEHNTNNSHGVNVGDSGEGNRVRAVIRNVANSGVLAAAPKTYVDYAWVEDSNVGVNAPGSNCRVGTAFSFNSGSDGVILSGSGTSADYLYVRDSGSRSVDVNASDVTIGEMDIGGTFNPDTRTRVRGAILMGGAPTASNYDEGDARTEIVDTSTSPPTIYYVTDSGGLTSGK